MNKNKHNQRANSNSPDEITRRRLDAQKSVRESNLIESKDSIWSILNVLGEVLTKAQNKMVRLRTDPNYKEADKLLTKFGNALGDEIDKNSP